MKLSMHSFFNWASMIMIVALIVACSGSDDKKDSDKKSMPEKDLIGEWAITEVEGDVAEVLAVEYLSHVWILEEKGKFQWCVEGDCDGGKWELDGDKLIINWEVMKVQLEIDKATEDEIKGNLYIEEEGERVKSPVVLKKGDGMMMSVEDEEDWDDEAYDEELEEEAYDEDEYYEEEYTDEDWVEEEEW